MMIFGPIPSSPGEAGGNKWFLVLLGFGILLYGFLNRKNVAEQDRTKALLVAVICFSLIAIGLYNIVMKR
jgi:hypothetical protein